MKDLWITLMVLAISCFYAGILSSVMVISIDFYRNEWEKAPFWKKALALFAPVVTVSVLIFGLFIYL